MPRRLLAQRYSLLRVAVLLAGVLLTTPLAAQDLWYAAYTKAVDAFNRNDYPEAERKFQEALASKQAPTTRGRSVRYYGQLRGEYIPELYLARIAASQKRWDDASRYADLAARYIRTSDREYALLVETRRLADAARAGSPAVAQNNPPTPAPPPNTSVQTGKPPAVTTELPSTSGPYTARPGAKPASPSAGPDEKAAESAAALARRQFDGLLTQATAALSNGDYAAATRSAQSAKDLGVDNAAADTLLRRINARTSLDATRNAETQMRIRALLATREWTQAGRLLDALARAGGDTRFIRDGQAAVARGLAQQGGGAIERAAVTDFYRGNYQAALDLFATLTPAQVTPRMLFYQACTNAALARLEGNAGAPRLQRARALFAQSDPRANTFERHRRYVSPEILDALER